MVVGTGPTFITIIQTNICVAVSFTLNRAADLLLVICRLVLTWPYQVTYT